MANKTQVPIDEKRKRKRELFIVFLVGVCVFLFSWGQFQLFEISDRLPFIHSIFFFGILNINIILLLFLLFLIFRNVVKIFAEKKGSFLGSSLKSKLIAAFLSFSFVPTVLMLFISVFYINSSFDKWFNVKMRGILKDAQELTANFIITEKKRNYFFAEEIAGKISLDSKAEIQRQLRSYIHKYRLDAIEYYPDVFSDPIVVIASGGAITKLPRVSLEFLQKGISEKVEDSGVYSYGVGNLIRNIVPVKHSIGYRGALVISSFIPLSLSSRMDDIASAYENFKDLDPLEYPIKSIYLIILILMTLVILLSASWMGFHLAKELSVPLERLALASKRVAKGVYDQVDIQPGSAEISSLIASFNKMTKTLERSESEVQEANENLQETLLVLDEHTKYIEVILSAVSTGVISVDQADYVTTVNKRAEELLGIDGDEFVGKKFQKCFNEDLCAYFEELNKMTEVVQRRSKSKKGTTVQKDVSLNIQDEAVSVRLSLSMLIDDKGDELGTVLMLDDLSAIATAQRAAAWREVARRIAHEIKNPLTPIKLSAQRLQKKFGENIGDESFKLSTDTIIQQVDQLKSMVNEFNNFARLPQAKMARASLNEMLEKTAALYMNSHRDVEFIIDLDAKLPEFDFDSEQLNRVMVNLFDNALSSMGNAPKKQLSIRTVYDDLLTMVRITVADTGPGIPPLELKRIFEPYFTTKAHGTGLGLAIVKRIIQDHQGFIRAELNRPQGLKMLIELPLS